MKILTKEEVIQIAATSEAASNLMKKFYPEFFAVVHIPVPVEKAVDLTNLAVRNRQLFLANGKFLGSINQSPIYVYPFKAIIVDPSFNVQVEIVNGRQLIVFENK